MIIELSQVKSANIFQCPKQYILGQIKQITFLSSLVIVPFY